MFTNSDRTIQTILFVELLGGLGDILIALPAIHALARSHPDARMTVLTFSPGSELLQSDPLIHQVVCVRPGNARRAVEEILEQTSFDLIVTDVSYEGIADLIRNSAAPYTVTNLWRSPPDNELVGDRFLSILLLEGFITPEAAASKEPQLYLTTEERTIAHSALGKLSRPLIMLCPDAGMAIKRWSTENFITLGQALQQNYGATVVILVGSDLEQAEQMVKAIGKTAQLWPRGSLRHLAAALSHADLMIAADTGPARIAAALNIPTITLFGPSWHRRYGQPVPHINLQGAPTCPERLIHNFTEQRCWYSGECPFEWQTCLDDISPTQVLEAAKSLLNNGLTRGLGAIAPANTNSNINCSTSTYKDEQPFAPTPNSPPTFPPPSPSPSSPYPSSSPQHPTPQNLVLLRLDNIGDVIMTSPALRSLRESLPHARITLIASPGGSQVADLLPWVDEVIPCRSLWQDLGRLEFDPSREWNLIDTLKKRQFDAAIIFTSFSQSPHPAALLCAIAGIPVRIGESKEQDIGTLTHAVPFAPIELHQVERNLRLIESVGFPVHDRRLELAIPPLALPMPESYILLNPWTSCASRNYNPVRFAIAAHQLSQRTGWPVAVIGLDKDRDRTQPILDILGDRAIDLLGKTSLGDVVALIARAKLVLTNNTSTMHIADATQTSNVVMFAGTELESQWQPRHSPSRLLRRPTPCSPCYAFTCPYNMECLDIPPEAVVEAALEVIDAQQKIMV
jgi:ADP-heptose:LPS heptosyltransferase